ncbi:uncharacterized protein LOC135205742 [Macrobrachium nipponense]|uniref:uncharacterized protein LOC135205742 n=1 Tax=Macrobrachium nipponense TaxID=159736 RepID=UPI0030C85CF9
MVTPLANTFLLVVLIFPTVSSGLRSERQVALGDAAANVTVPVSLPFYDGIDAPLLDDCPRDEVKLANGRCYQLLTQGPCLLTHYIVLDPITKKAYCGPRLCSPDRIFVFSKQLCYDPSDPEICSNGLQLFQTGYGTPVCQCPDGTYEDEDDDQDESACESLLTPSSSCPPGQVLWFRNFSSPRECVADPCEGQNLRRAPGEHFLVPSAVDGQCYPLGQGAGACPEGSWFTLDLNTLKGICSSLEDAGYLVLNDELLAALMQFYGPTIPKSWENNTAVEMNGLITQGHPVTVLQNISLDTDFSPEKNHAQILKHPTLRPLINAQQPTFHKMITTGRWTHGHPLRRTPVIEIYPRTRIEMSKGNLVTQSSVQGSLPGIFSLKTSLDIGLPIARRFIPTDVHFADAITQLLIGMPPSRKKRGSGRRRELRGRKHRRNPRTPLPHFAPGNLFDTRLVSCRPGSERDINAKCRDTILPSRSLSRMPLGASGMNRPSLAASPVTPKPSCSQGQIYSIQRLCVNASAAVNSINANEIG